MMAAEWLALQPGQPHAPLEAIEGQGPSKRLRRDRGGQNKWCAHKRSESKIVHEECLAKPEQYGRRPTDVGA